MWKMLFGPQGFISLQYPKSVATGTNSPVGNFDIKRLTLSDSLSCEYCMRINLRKSEPLSSSGLFRRRLCYGVTLAPFSLRFDSICVFDSFSVITLEHFAIFQEKLLDL